jgi:hypothetical protein
VIGVIAFMIALPAVLPNNVIPVIASVIPWARDCSISGYAQTVIGT